MTLLVLLELVIVAVVGVVVVEVAVVVVVALALLWSSEGLFAGSMKTASKQRLSLWR